MTVNIVVPEIGESIVDARVVRWLKKAGDTVAVGEPLVEIETDKVDVDVPAPKSGRLQSIAHGDGADVKVGDVLGVVDTDAGASETPAPEKRAQEQSTEAAAPAATPRESKAPKAAEREAPAPETKVPETKAPETKAPETKAPAAKTPAPRAREARPPRGQDSPGARTPQTTVRDETRERLSKRRATIARRLVEAQRNAALLTTFNEVDMSAVMAVRERQKEAFKAKYGVGIGIASFFIKAAVAALAEFPRLNAEIQDDEVVLKHYYDIGVAVGADEGLVVPVIRDADRLSFAEIEQRIRDFAARAGNGTLTLDDLRGGTFSITNGGVYGSLMSTPIVNPPQVGILGLHAIKQRPVGVDGQIVLRPMMYVALTYDHRLVDGAEAVRFLVRIKALIEDPSALLIAM